jgi:hypothetical protein
MSPQNQNISRIQNLINTYQTEKVLMEQNFERRRAIIRQQFLNVTTGDEGRHLMTELGYLNEEYRRELQRINKKIDDARNELNLF